MPRKIYMGGICGMGMAPLALFLKAESFDVFGYDDSANLNVKSLLENSGIKVSNAFERSNLDSAEAFIISSALAAKVENFNSEKVIRRGEYLAKICATRRLVAVAGSHGKSSVTSMLSYAIDAEKKENCGYIIGALPTNFPPAKHCKNEDFLIAEIDESDGTIENFYPEITVALNSDLDHTDKYQDKSHIERMFERLFARTRKTIILLEGDEALLSAAKKSGKNIITVKKQAEFISTNELFARKAFEEIFKTPLSQDIFKNFKGIIRRQEILKSDEKLTVIADYAHHPAEVDAFLGWMDSRFSERKIIIFQPHRYSRTKFFAKDFAEILSGRNNTKTYLCNVYPASEPFDSEGTSEKILEYASDITLLDSDKNLSDIFEDAKKSSDKICIAIVGAGDIYFKAKKNL